MIYEKSEKVILNSEMLELVDGIFERYADEPDAIVVFMKIIMDKTQRIQLKKTWQYGYLKDKKAFKKFIRNEQQRNATSRYLKKKSEERED